MNKQILVELQETMGSDKSIAEAAWTSSTTLQGKQKRTSEDVKRVVNMLADSKHSTPFESVVLRFWIKMPIATDRQFMTHRLQSASGMSGRYRTMPKEYLHIPEDIDHIISKIDFNAKTDYYEFCNKANKLYDEYTILAKKAEGKNLITNSEYKRFREFFRGVLPQHNMTERVTIMNLRSFANFIKLRLKPEAQPEIQEVAKQMLEAVKQANICPEALFALERNNWII